MKKFQSYVWIRYAAWVTVAWCVGPIETWSQQAVQEDANSQNVFVVESKAEAAIRNTLNGPASFDFPDYPFIEVVTKLESNLGLPIVVHESAKDAGLDNDELINISLKEISAHAGLRIILSKYDCSYAVTDDVLLIASIDEIEELLGQRIYDFSDLALDRQELSNVIVETVLPDSWEENGGIARLRTISVNQRNLLIVSHLEEGHRQVGNLIEGLRRAVHGKPASTTTSEVKINTYAIPENLKTNAEQIVEMIEDSMPDVGWSADNRWLKSYGNIVVIKHEASILNKVDKLLGKVGVPNNQNTRAVQQGFRGGGLFNVKPESSPATSK